MNQTTYADLLSRPKLRAIMRINKESILQQQCVYWFRAQYPQYAMLMTHPINEGSDHSALDHRRQVIHKKEGTVAGVPDLLLFLPSKQTDSDFATRYYHGLGIEMKMPKGSQSQEQKDYEHIFTAAGYYYVVVKSLDAFKNVVNMWIAGVDPARRQLVASAHVELIKEQNQREQEFFKKVIGKK